MSWDVAIPESEMAAARADAEALMQDTFAAYSPAAKTTNADGYEVDGWTAQGSTPGKVQGGSTQARDTNIRYVTVGTVERPVVEGGLHIPLTAPMPSVGWEYLCTAVGAASDPGLLGRRYRVVDVPVKSHATARRLDVVEVS